MPIFPVQTKKGLLHVELEGQDASLTGEARVKAIQNKIDAGDFSEAFELPLREQRETGKKFGIRRPISPLTRSAREVVKQSALPVGLGATGVGLGPAVGLGASGTMALEGLMSAAGEGINQALGITPASLLNLATSALGPQAGRIFGATGTRVLKGGLKQLPGSTSGFMDEGISRIRATVDKLRGPNVASAFNRLGSHNPSMRMDNTLRQIDTLLAKEDILVEGFNNPQLQKQLVNLKSAIERGNGSVPFKFFREHLETVGPLTKTVKGAIPDKSTGVYKSLFAAMSDDLDTAAQRPVFKAVNRGGKVDLVEVTDKAPAAKLFKEARQAHRRQRAVDNLEEIIESRITPGPSGTDIEEQINARLIIKGLKPKRPGDKIDFMRKAFEKGELDEIEGILKEIKSVPLLPPASGQQFGSGQLFRKSLVAGGAAGAMAKFVGTDPTLLVSTAIATFVGVPYILSRALMTKAGRKVVRSVITPKGLIDRNGIAIIGNFLAGGRHKATIDFSSRLGGSAIDLLRGGGARQQE